MALSEANKGEGGIKKWGDVRHCSGQSRAKE